MVLNTSRFTWSLWGKRLKEMSGIVAISILFGILYPVVNREFNNPMAFFNGAAIGFLGGLAIALSEDYSHYGKIRRENILLKITRNTILYTLYFALIIALIFGITYGLLMGPGFVQYYVGPEFKNFIFQGDYLIILVYALFFCGLVSFSVSMSHKVESKVIMNIISGKYQQPKTEQRIFLAIDLNNSTTIAEKLGEEQFFAFLNQFYLDLTPAIIGTDAEIYRYVGDQVTLSWPVRSQKENNHCLNAYLMASQQVSDNCQFYLDHWDLAPAFKAVIHAGTVVAGEIGDAKRQFVYHGELFQTMTVTEKLCKTLGVQLLITSTAADLMDLSSFKLSPVKQLDITETADEITLFTLMK